MILTRNLSEPLGPVAPSIPAPQNFSDRCISCCACNVADVMLIIEVTSMCILLGEDHVLDLLIFTEEAVMSILLATENLSGAKKGLLTKSQKRSHEQQITIAPCDYVKNIQNNFRHDYIKLFVWIFCMYVFLSVAMVHNCQI